MAKLSFLVLIFILAVLAVVCTGCGDYKACKDKYDNHPMSKRFIVRCLAIGE